MAVVPDEPDRDNLPEGDGMKAGETSGQQQEGGLDVPGLPGHPGYDGPGAQDSDPTKRP